MFKFVGNSVKKIGIMFAAIFAITVLFYGSAWIFYDAMPDHFSSTDKLYFSGGIGIAALFFAALIYSCFPAKKGV